MLTKPQKAEIIAQLKEKFGRQKIAVFTDFHGTSVAKASALRRLIRKAGAEYKVAKKNLLDRALEESNIDFRTKELKGEIGVVFGYADEVSPVKILVKFIKDTPTTKILGGILGNQTIKEKEVMVLAKLPSREVLLTQLLGIMQGQAQRLVMILQAPMQNLVVVLQKIKQ